MLKYNGVEYRSLEEQVRKNMEDISELKEAGGSTPVPPVQEDFPKAVPLGDDLPTTATQGTIEAEKIAVLDANKGNFVYWQGKKIFTQQDNNGTQITLIHIDNEKAEQLTITRATLGFVITEISLGGGGGTPRAVSGQANVNDQGVYEVPLGTWENCIFKRVTVFTNTYEVKITEVGAINQYGDFAYAIDDDVEGMYVVVQFVIERDGNIARAYQNFVTRTDIPEIANMYLNGPTMDIEKVYFKKQNNAEPNQPYIVEDI